MTIVPTRVNQYSPANPKTYEKTYWDDVTNTLGYKVAYGELKSGLGGASQAVDDFLRRNGPTNPKFSTSTAGRLTSNQSRLKITRGFIRRSSPDSGDSMSLASLNFMYNPTEIVRDYVSYLDQAALDPFNTVYNSGNLIVAPSFVNFSFTLLFDRQIEAAARTTRGVLDDYKYFDMVVRNVPPSSGSSGIPDNGIMMANPKDITVVFSKDLTVQGRPTNARVQFIKFDRDMVPTRMIVSLTMIITYFGPIRQAYGFDTYQSTGDYEALVPYSQVYSEEYTTEQLKAATKGYNDAIAAISFLDAAQPRESPYRNSAGGVGAADAAVTGANGVSVPSNTSLQAATLAAAKQRASVPGVFYSSPNNRIGPKGYDCSGFVSMAYKDCGASDVLPGPGSTSSIHAANAKAGWKRKMALVVNGVNSYDKYRQYAQPGDLLLRVNSPSGRNGHIAFFDGWDGEKAKVVHATNVGGPNGIVGADTMSKSNLNTYNFLIRPAASGSLGARSV
jgi:cell wall-associated NlpC family hydrolase